MHIYIIVFLINIFLAFGADRTYIKRKSICLFFLCMIVFVNVLFVGLRDFSVGNDTSLYIDNYFSEAGKLTSLSDLESLEGTDYNLGFLFLAYLANLFGNNSQILLVFTELFIISNIVIGIYQFRKTLPVKFWSFFLLFGLLYYMNTMNIMRQWCALSLLFFAFSQLIRGRWKFYLIVQFFAFFFHSTSIVFIIVTFLYFVSKIESNSKKIIILSVVVGSIIYFLFSYYTVLLYFGGMNIISEIYVERYGAGSEYENTQQFGFGMLDMLNYIIPLILIYLGWRKKVAPKDVFFMIITLFVTNFLLEQLKYIMIFMFRLAHYVGLVFCVYGSILFSSKKVNVLAKAGTIIIWLYVYYRTYFTVNYLTDHIKYTSKILGI